MAHLDLTFIFFPSSSNRLEIFFFVIFFACILRFKLNCPSICIAQSYVGKIFFFPFFIEYFSLYWLKIRSFTHKSLL